MTKLRIKYGIPVVGDFAGSNPPLIENFLTGELYSISQPGIVIRVGPAVEPRTSDPASPYVGQIWLRTDL